MATYALATDRPVSWAVLQGDTVIEAGQQPANSITFAADTNTMVSDASENAFLGKVAGKAGSYRPLPASGWLEAGDIYGYNGGLVLVRQSHNRTEHAPADAPALFAVYRANAGEALDWVAGEQVMLGARRLHDGVLYECLQAHQTEYAPPLAPALWKLAVVEGTIPAWVQPTGAHDAYALDALVTHNGKTWRSLYAANVWEPGVAGWAEVV